MYERTADRIGALGQEFQQKVEAYNAAVCALNTKKELFPANLFSGSFFNIPDGIYLKHDDLQLLPPQLVADHLSAARRQLPS